MTIVSSMKNMFLNDEDGGIMMIKKLWKLWWWYGKESDEYSNVIMM